VSRGALIASCVLGASCWTGPTPPAPGAAPVRDRRPANTKFRIAQVFAVGVGARGHYRVEANAGPLYEDEFEATWVGTPWEVRACDYEMNPP
jgi:hypothetical protein